MIVALFPSIDVELFSRSANVKSDINITEILEIESKMSFGSAGYRDVSYPACIELKDAVMVTSCKAQRSRIKIPQISHTYSQNLRKWDVNKYESN